MKLLNLPHREAGCHWTGNTTGLTSEPWLSALDLAVYHLPGADVWQSYRETMKSVPIGERYQWLVQWLEASRKWDPAVQVPLADLVRVMNLCRSLRGFWSWNPEIEELAHQLKRSWDYAKERS